MSKEDEGAVGAIRPLCGDATKLKPRVWTGEWGERDHGAIWLWYMDKWELKADNFPLYPGSIFIGWPHEPKLDPRQMESMKCCKEVDW